MNSSQRIFLSVSMAYLLSAGVGTFLAIQQNLPAEFGGLLHRQAALGDFVSGLGTALSPPLILLAVQVIFMALRVRPEAFLQRIGAGGLMVLGIMYFIGQLGEPVLWRLFTAGGFRVERAIVIAANLVLPALMAWWGLAFIRMEKK